MNTRQTQLDVIPNRALSDIKATPAFLTTKKDEG